MIPLISIIVPIYNVEKYLKKCVDSIINQTYKNLEIILVDDGSPDNCGEICDEYSKKDERIRVIHKENGGLSDARNAGLDICSGEYIAFIDSDDYIYSEMIEELYNNLLQHDADMSLCNFEYVDESGNDITELSLGSPLQDECLTKYQMFEKLCKSKWWYYVIICNKLYKKEIFDSLRFKKGKIHEDEFIAHHIIDRCDRVSCTKKSMYCYVQRNNSIMEGNINNKNLFCAEAFMERTDYFITKKMYKLAYKTFLSALERIYLFYTQVNLNDRNNVEKFKALKKQYNKIYSKIMVTKIPVKRKIGFTLCFFDIRLYSYVGKAFSKIKKFGLKIRSYLKLLKNILKFLVNFYEKKLKYKNKFFCLLMTPEYDNIGDSAITIAIKKFLEDCFPDYYIFEMTDRVFLNHGDKYKSIIYKVIRNHKILINGGGWLGTLWFDAGEAPLRNILENTQNSDITIFPQTMYYEDSEWGRAEFEKSKEIYNRNKKLKICLRENYSYESAKGAYLNTFLIPDIVMYLNQSNENEIRQGIKICLRSDIEKTILPEEEKKIFDFAKAHYRDNIGYVDMIYHRAIRPEEREAIVKDHFEKFKTAELVITDRLHGMIFAAITGTPCIVVNSKSHKVKGCYEWIKDLGYIKFADSVDELESIYKSMDLSIKYSYDNEHLMKYYNELAKIIMKG